MAIKLSNLTFTDEDDIVPASALEQILNTEVANTLAVDDIIIGTGNDYGFENVSVLSTDDGNDTITGIENLEPEFDSSYDLVNSGTLDADDDNDIITGTSRDDGIVNSGTLSTDEGRDILTGTASSNNRLFGILTIDRIKCLKNGADRIGPDDTYITINGTRIWGDYNMRRGRTRSVNYYSRRDLRDPNNWDPRVPHTWDPLIELYDLDNSWSGDDLMGRFVPDVTFGMERRKEVRGNGSIYEVYYSYTYSLEPF